MDLLKTGAAALGVRLDDSQVDQFRLYHRELVSWNTRVNLTAVTEWTKCGRATSWTRFPQPPSYLRKSSTEVPLWTSAAARGFQAWR